MLWGYHKGAYEEIQDSFKRIKEWGRNLNLEDTILALNIIDQFVEQDNDNYSTRIEVGLQIQNRGKAMREREKMQ